MVFFEKIFGGGKKKEPQKPQKEHPTVRGLRYAAEKQVAQEAARLAEQNSLDQESVVVGPVLSDEEFEAKQQASSKSDTAELQEAREQMGLHTPEDIIKKGLVFAESQLKRSLTSEEKERVISRINSDWARKQTAESGVEKRSSGVVLETEFGQEDEKIAEFMKTIKEKLKSKEAELSIQTKILEGVKFKEYTQAPVGRNEAESYAYFSASENSKGNEIFRGAVDKPDLFTRRSYLSDGNAVVFLNPPAKGDRSRRYDLAMQYAVDGDGYKDGREITANIELFIDEESARYLLAEMKNNPQNFWKVLNSIEPDLLKVSKPRENDYSKGLVNKPIKRPLGLVVYDIDKYTQEVANKVGTDKDRAKREYFEGKNRENNFEVLPWDKKG